jgi:transposase
MTTPLESDQEVLPDEHGPLTELDCLRQEVNWLNERVTWFERQMFGERSERVVEPENKDSQFLPGLDLKGIEPPVETGEIAAHRRKKKKRKSENDNSNGLLIPDNLPVEQTILDLSEEEKVCAKTGEKLVRIGEEITRKLGHRSGYYFVKEIVRPKYAIPSKEEEGVFISEPPKNILPKVRADESLLAEIVTRKFADHLPLYRLSEIFSRDDVQITRQLLSQWVIRLGAVLMPLYLEMLRQIKASGNAFIDETPLKLQVKGKGKLQQAYMWVLAGGEGADPPHRVYWFCENRNYQHAYDLLEGFSGSLHSDKYGAYVNLAKKEAIDWHPCWAHIRRYFEEIQTGDLEFRKMFLRKTRYLFMLERVSWARSSEERLKIRKEKEEPIIDELIKAVKDRVENGKLLPKSKFSKALNYVYGLIPHLKNYIKKPNARLDNMVAERAFRPLVIGRKNWLFVGSMKGGKATAVLLSLVQTCRALDINPREYLEDIMRRFPGHPADQVHELLPNQWKASRQESRTPTKPLHVR